MIVNVQWMRSAKKHNLVPRVFPPGGGKLSYNYNESIIANDFLNLIFYALKDECPVDALRACVFIYLPYI